MACHKVHPRWRLFHKSRSANPSLAILRVGAALVALANEVIGDQDFAAPAHGRNWAQNGHMLSENDVAWSYVGHPLSKSGSWSARTSHFADRTGYLADKRDKHFCDRTERAMLQSDDVDGRGCHRKRHRQHFELDGRGIESKKQAAEHAKVLSACDQAAGALRGRHGDGSRRRSKSDATEGLDHQCADGMIGRG